MPGHEVRRPEGVGRGVARPLLPNLRTTMNDLYLAATQSFQQELDRLEKDGRKNSSDWHLAKGLLQLTEGLQQARDAIYGNRSRAPGRHATRE